jgi:hypothetical protein
MKKMTPVQRRNITMPTIEQAVSNYVIAMTLEGKNSSYADWLRRRLGDFAKFFQTSRGQARIDSLTIEDGRAFVKYLMDRKHRYTDHKLRNKVRL